jgi:uncharacterized protein YuzE
MSKLTASIAIGPFTFTDCSYDAEADIAYLSVGEPKEAISWESPEGHLVRLDPDTGELVGVTLLYPRQRCETTGAMTITFPEHVLAVAEGRHSPLLSEPLTLPRAELTALCA